MKKRQKFTGQARSVVPGVRFSSQLSPLVRKATGYIEKNLLSIETSSDISRALGVSREHLSRTFSRETGVKIWEYVNRGKVERAKAMLKGTSALVREMYPKLGFGCQSTFYNAFRRYVGTTPSKFKKGDTRKKSRKR
jgi:two-component system response regulator YesN